MPWIGVHNGEKRGAFQVPRKTDVKCPTCGGRMRVWSESTDGKARHFKHIGEMGHSNGGGGSCESVSESDEHLKWKNFAAEKLEMVFSDNVRECRVEKELKAPYSDRDRRVGDAVLVFDEFDDQLGNGIVVEVQHKNESKDIEATTRDYKEQGLAVVWAYADDFSTDHCRLSEVDFRKRAKESVWPHVVPDEKSWWNPLYSPRTLRDRWEEALVMGLSKSGVRATLPPEWCDRKCREIWESQRWADLFPDTMSLKVGNFDHFIPMEGYDHQLYMSEVADSLTPIGEMIIKLPTEWFDQKSLEIWRSMPWEALFSAPKDHTDIWCYSKVPAKIPPEMFEEVKFRSMDWEDLFGPYPENVYTKEANQELGLPRTVLKFTIPKWYVRGMLSEVKAPRGPFDDVQCWMCGSYWHVSEERTTCASCGTKVDFDWNLETGRLNSIPNYVTNPNSENNQVPITEMIDQSECDHEYTGFTTDVDGDTSQVCQECGKTLKTLSDM